MPQAQMPHGIQLLESQQHAGHIWPFEAIPGVAPGSTQHTNTSSFVDSNFDSTGEPIHSPSIGPSLPPGDPHNLTSQEQFIEPFTTNQLHQPIMKHILYVGAISFDCTLKVSSFYLPDDCSSMNVTKLAKLLEKDLGVPGARRENLPHLIVDAFPDHLLPFKVDFPLLEALSSVYNFNTKRWIDIPEFKELQIAEWLNKITKAVETHLNIAARRDWNAGSFSSPIPGSPIRHKPDITLLDRNAPLPIDWHAVRSIVEVTTRQSLTPTLIETMDGKTCVAFLTQHDRLSMPILCFYGPDKACLTVTDRQGQLRSTILSIHTLTDALLLLRILVALAFGSDEILGYDKTMQRMPCHHPKGWAHNIEYITVNEKRYKVHELVFVSQSFLGRATKVWRVSPEGEDDKQYILKDSWIQLPRTPESRFLLQMKNYPINVPRLIAADDVTGDNPGPLSTRTIRWRIYEGGEQRRRRIVMTPSGEHIASFKTMTELVGALRDLVYILWYLAKNGIYHRDISFNNIMLTEIFPAPERRALLINFDDATCIHFSQDLMDVSSGRTGTPAYMALDLLLDSGPVTHKAQYDLESIFYVLIYICVTFRGPNFKVCPKEDFPPNLSIRRWFDLSFDLFGLGRLKQGDLLHFERAVLSAFSPGFNCLKPLALKLYEGFWPDGASRYNNSMGYKKMVDILTAEWENLLDLHCRAVYPEHTNHDTAKKAFRQVNPFPLEVASFIISDLPPPITELNDPINFQLKVSEDPTVVVCDDPIPANIPKDISTFGRVY